MSNISGAALTADSLFSEEPEEEGKVESTNVYKPVEPLKLTQTQDLEANVVNDEAREEEEQEQMAEDEACTKLVAEEGERTVTSLHSPLSLDNLPSIEQVKAVKQLPRPVYWSIISVMVAVASIVIGDGGEGAEGVQLGRKGGIQGFSSLE